MISVNSSTLMPEAIDLRSPRRLSSRASGSIIQNMTNERNTGVAKSYKKLKTYMTSHTVTKITAMSNAVRQYF